MAKLALMVIFTMLAEKGILVKGKEKSILKLIQ